MRTWKFHGLSIGQRGRAEFLERAFAYYPEVEEASADLVFEVEWTDAAHLESNGQLDSKPTFVLSEVKAHALADGRFVVFDGFARFEIAPDGRTVAVRLAADDPREPQFVVDRTLLTCLMMVLRHHRLFVLHAAGVVDPLGRTLLIVGHGGAGKSSTAITLLEAGCRYLGDDTILLSAEPEPRVRGLHKRFHVGGPTLAAFPRLHPWLEPPYRNFSYKRAFDPRRAWPSAQLDQADPPALLVFPSVTAAGSTSINLLSKAEAFARLVESSASLVATGAAERPLHLSLLQRFVNGATCLELHLGGNLFDEPRRLLDLLLCM